MEDEYEPVVHLMSAAAGKPALVPWINVEFSIVIKVVGAGAIISLAGNIWYSLIFMGVVLGFCRIVTMIDDQAFRIIGIWIRLQWLTLNWRFWEPTVYTSNKPRF